MLLSSLLWTLPLSLNTGERGLCVRFRDRNSREGSLMARRTRILVSTTALAMLCSIGVAGVARADTITVFNNRAAWLAALSGAPTTIDFGVDVNPPVGSFVTFPLGLVDAGVQFTPAQGAGLPGVGVVDTAYFSQTYNRGSDQLFSDVIGGGIKAALPAGIDAAGFDIFTVQVGD